jgi:uncharacterized protein (DUF362 family)
MNPGAKAKYRAYIAGAGDGLKATLERGLQYINCDKYINSNSTVFLKPNFTFPYHKKGVTTSPDLLRCLLEILVSKAGRVTLGESDGANHAFRAEEAFEGLDMYRICREAGVELVSLSTLPSETIEGRISGKRVKVQLPKLLLEGIDCFISVPVFKVHAMTTITLSLKNSWGCVPDTMRCLEHQDLAYKLALIATLLKPKIVVIDGTYALDQHGPMYGEPVKTDMLMVADNTVAADALGATVMGFAPHRVKHIAIAAKAGLGSLALEDMEVNTDWKKFSRQFHIHRTLIDRASGLLFYSGALARLVMASPLTPLIYKVAGMLRSSDE